jgi:AcrR family transcriptional regulator
MDTALPRRQRIKLQNRQFILDGARRLFAGQGYDAVTVRDIIRATPLAAGTFYNYFTSKEDVREALRAEMALAIRPRLAEGRAEAITADEFLSAFFSAVFALRTEMGAAPGIGDLYAGFDDLRADLEAAMARGLFLSRDAGALAAALLAAAAEIGARLTAEGGDTGEATAAATLLFLRGVQPPP